MILVFRALSLSLVLVFMGCSMLKFPVLNAPPKPETTYQYSERFERNPTAIAVGGKVIVVEQQIRTVDAGFKQQKKQLGFWKRTMNWIGSWSIITIIVVLIAASFGITAPALFIAARFRTLKNTTRSIVRSIHQSNAIETSPELKSKLHSNLNDKSKRLVDDLKRS